MIRNILSIFDWNLLKIVVIEKILKSSFYVQKINFQRNILK